LAKKIQQNWKRIVEPETTARIKRKGEGIFWQWGAAEKRLASIKTETINVHNEEKRK